MNPKNQLHRIILVFRFNNYKVNDILNIDFFEI